MKGNENINGGSRLPYIDFLKFIGLTGIIIAHVGSPSWMMMARSFDVPFMVVLSSLLANRSYEKLLTSGATVKDYYLSRFKRLVFPTWIFLLLYFSISFVFKGGHTESIKKYIASFALTRYGIGYVWIILIYLYSAMLVPLFAKLKTSRKGIFIVCVSYLIYEIAYYYQVGLNGNIYVKALVDTTFYYIVPYGVLTFLGYNYIFFKRSTKAWIAAVSAFAFAGLCVFYRVYTGNFQLVQIAKYPPRIYYLSYGIACSFSLLLYCEGKALRVFNNVIIKFISAHSMWIYLWHIFVLQVYANLHLPEIWFIKLVVVYCVSSGIVVAINCLLDKIEENKKIAVLKYLRG